MKPRTLKDKLTKGERVYGTLISHAVNPALIDVADRKHAAAGCWFGEPRQVVRTIGQGARFVVYANDSKMMADAMNTAFTEFRKA